MLSPHMHALTHDMPYNRKMHNEIRQTHTIKSAKRLPSENVDHSIFRKQFHQLKNQCPCGVI